MKELSGAAFTEWYTLACAAGVALVVAALAAGHNPLLIVGLGWIFVGLGEFINHPYQEWIGDNPYGLGAARIYGRPRSNRPVGVLIVIAGGALIIWGVVRLLLD